MNHAKAFLIGSTVGIGATLFCYFSGLQSSSWVFLGGFNTVTCGTSGLIVSLEQERKQRSRAKTLLKEATDKAIARVSTKSESVNLLVAMEQIKDGLE